MVSFAERRWVSVVLMLLVSSLSFVSCHEGEESRETTITKESEVVEDLLYVTPKAPVSAYLAENFDDASHFKSRWIISDARKEDADDSIAKYDGQWSVESALESSLKGDLGLVLKSKAKHHAISTKFTKPFVFDKKPLVVQYEVNFQNGQECGGAYLKLLTDSKDLNLKKFQDKTPYTIMFGPDKCGNDAKLHFIFQHRNPVNGTLSEKHCKKPAANLDEYFKDKKPHLYTLVLNPDNTFEVLVDNVAVNQGDLFEDFTPPVNPPAEIDDPNEMKPADWDEREKIVDPDAKKPEDWNEDASRQIPDPSAVKPSDWLDEESDTIPDPNAEKPSDWDDEMDGEWEAPLINNPKCESVGCGEWKAPMIENPEYKGKWYAPFIDNPNYQGRWKPKRIPNPHFFDDKHPFKMSPISAVGLELWSMSDAIYFDNILVVDDKRIAEQWAKETWELKKKKGDSDSLSFWSVVTYMCKSHPRLVWFVYFVYVAIPIIYYVRNIQRWLREEGLVSRLMNYTNSHPWLYAVYVVVIGLPVVLVVVFCCSSEEKNKKRVSVRAKKTDEVTQDDNSAKFEEADEDEVDVDNSTSKRSHSQDESSRTAEEQELEDDDAGAANVAEGEEEEEEAAEVDVGVEESQNADDEPEVRRSPRKRKIRKD